MIKNICSKCKYQERCMPYRYSNVRAKFMTKIKREKNKDGDFVIYVSKCEKFELYNPFKETFLKKFSKKLDK